MTQIFVKYNPYKLETQIEVNGNPIAKDSSLCSIVKGKRLQEWIGKFPQMLIDELNTVDFSIEFYGMQLDWDDFEDSFKEAQSKGLIKNLRLKFTEGRSDDDINEKIAEVFSDLTEGPIDDFRDPKLVRAFENINNSVFPINVVATMSSGKSTLINALLGKKLMPSKNEACTATITEILDNDSEQFAAVVYDENNVVLRDIPKLTYEIMTQLNDDASVQKIAVEGNIPFLDARSTALMLVDTPGPNNSQNQAHKNMTYRAINSDSNNLIIYVLNGTQLSTNDDASLLQYVANQIKKGGKLMRDRFLFVINKMDGFNPEEEDIGKAIEASKRYLAKYEIYDPQIFPCSAYTALNIRTYFDGINVDKLTREELKKLPTAARDTIPMIDKFVESEAMHLEKYSTLSPSAQKELNYKLAQAEQSGDTTLQALIHSGIYSIEAAITAYVKKYAKTKKIKDLVESFQEVMESSEVLYKAKAQVTTDEQAAKAAIERANAIQAKIDNGKEAANFEKRVEKLDPMKKIKDKADTLKNEASKKTSTVFESYGDTITSREDAKRLVSIFARMSSDSIAELTSELDSVIKHEVMETGENMLIEYKEKLNKIDESSDDKKLNFSTENLIKGALNNMKENAKSWCTNDFADETVDEVGEVTTEEKVYYEKVGQKEERVADGTEKVKVGTKKVKVGSHRVKTGTRKVKNPDRDGFFGFFKFWKPWNIEEDVYETVDDYKNEDVYETVVKYKTVMKDIFEERRETIEKFSVETRVIQMGLISKMRRNLDEGIDEALKFADKQVGDMKSRFKEMFRELDQIIKDKYAELTECVNDQKNKEERMKENKKLLLWIEANRDEISKILDI